MQYLVVCFDGTGNSPVQKDEEYYSISTRSPRVCVESNVLKLWCALTGNEEKYQPSDLLSSHEYKYYGLVSSLAVGEEYPGEALYFNGVGSQGDSEKITTERAFGTGTSTRIRDAYRFLAERYKANTKIYIFGFSRGAFAARSLAGFIRHVGMPISRRTLPEEELPKLWKAYREAKDYKGGLASQMTGRNAVTIEFLGLWDTVGSLAFQKTFNSFHQISPTGVAHVRHALALDEVRPHFVPSYWEGKFEDGQTVKEVWFCGVHSNIGGGYQKTGLSNISYIWMLRELSKTGAFAGSLERVPEYSEESVEVTGWKEMRDSYKEFYRGVRIILAVLKGGESVRNVSASQKFHPSVFEWIAKGGYQPRATIHNNAAIVLRELANRVEEDSEDWLMDMANSRIYKELKGFV